MTLTDSVVVENTAVSGGGVFNAGALTLNDSTLPDNTAADGVGIDNIGALTLADGTASGDLAANGGGIGNFGGTVTLADGGTFNPAAPAPSDGVSAAPTPTDGAVPGDGAVNDASLVHTDLLTPTDGPASGALSQGDGHGETNAPKPADPAEGRSDTGARALTDNIVSGDLVSQAGNRGETDAQDAGGGALPANADGGPADTAAPTRAADFIFRLLADDARAEVGKTPHRIENAALPASRAFGPRNLALERIDPAAPPESIAKGGGADPFVRWGGQDSFGFAPGVPSVRTMGQWAGLLLATCLGAAVHPVEEESAARREESKRVERDR